MPGGRTGYQLNNGLVGCGFGGGGVHGYLSWIGLKMVWDEDGLG